MDYFAKRIQFLKDKYALDEGLLIEGMAPTKETTLEEVSERFRQSQEKGYKQTFEAKAKTNHKGKRFGLAIVVR